MPRGAHRLGHKTSHMHVALSMCLMLQTGLQLLCAREWETRMGNKNEKPEQDKKKPACRTGRNEMTARKDLAHKNLQE